MALDRFFDTVAKRRTGTAGEEVPGDDLRFVLPVVVCALALRLFHLGHQSLWIDEILTLIVATPKPDHPIWTLLLHNIHGPLHTFVVYLFRSASENDFWMRLPSALAGTASVWFLYAWVRELLGRPTARVAAILLAINPLHVYYSQELRNYAFVFLFSLMASYYLERLTRRWAPRRAAGYAACVAAAALSNFSAAFIFVVHTVIWFMRQRVSRTTLTRWIGVCIIILVVIAPWVYRIYTFVDVSDLVTPVRPGAIEAQERLRGETTFTLGALPYTFYAFSVGFSLGPSLRELHIDHSMSDVFSRYGGTIAGVALLFGTLFVLGMVAIRRRGLRWLEIALYLAVPLVGTLLLNWQNAKAFNVRYVLLALPAWLAVIAAGIVALRPRPRWGFVFAVAVVTFASLWRYEFDGRYSREDVRGAVRYIAEQPEAFDCLFAPTVWQIVEHYAPPGTPVYEVFRRHWVPVERVDEQLFEMFSACNAFWYIRAREWVDDPDDYSLRAVQARYRQAEVVRFDGVTLFRFEPRDRDGKEP